MPGCLQEPEEAIRYLGLQLKAIVSCPIRMLETDLGSSERGAMLLTAKLHIQPME